MDEPYPIQDALSAESIETCDIACQPEGFDGLSGRPGNSRSSVARIDAVGGVGL